MAYEGKTIWKNREVENPRTFMMQQNPDGTITLIPAEGTIIEPGTPIIAAIMNNIEDGIKEAHDAIGNINDPTLPAELKGKALTEQTKYVLANAGKVKSVNNKTGDVVLSSSDVGAVPTSRTVNNKALNANISLTKSDIGLGSVENYGIATQIEAEAGTANNKYVTPIRVKEAIEKNFPQVEKDKLKMIAIKKKNWERSTSQSRWSYCNR